MSLVDEYHAMNIELAMQHALITSDAKVRARIEQEFPLPQATELVLSRKDIPHPVSPVGISQFTPPKP